jgi:hypothetical protein
MSATPDADEQYLRFIAMEIAARLPEAPRRAHRVLEKVMFQIACARPHLSEKQSA